jgi:hypothetical protein
MTTTEAPTTTETDDLLGALAKHRELFLRTVDGVSDSDARRRTPVS